MMMPRDRYVPGSGERLLRLLLPATMRQQMLADLAQLAASRPSPRRWYWGQVLRVLWPPTLIGLYREATHPAAAWSAPEHDGGNFVEGLLTDIRRAARSLWRRPAFTLTAVATLAIGIGSTTAMFSVVYGVALRPLPYEHADRLFTICERASVISKAACVLSPPNAEDIRERVKAIEYLGVGRRWDAKFGSGDDAEAVSAAVVTPDVFRAFGIRPRSGRLIEDGDLIGAPGTVAVISEGFWRTRFGARDVVGETIILDGKPVTIAGVLPATVDIPRLEQVDVWRPLHVAPRDEANRGWAGFHSFARLRDGETLAGAANEVAAVTTMLKATYFADREGWGTELVSLTDLVLGQSRQLLLLFLAAVGLLLLVACANVANLMLEQSAARRQEWGVRTALGASPERIVALQLTESFMLAAGGAVVGLVIAFAGVKGLRYLAPPGLPRLDEVAVDSAVLGFTIATAAFTALVFGVVPAVRAARVNVCAVLKAGGRTVAPGRWRLSSTLVVSQIAIALTLVAGATVLARSFLVLASWSPGFDPRRVVTFALSTSTDRHPNRELVSALWKSVESELRTIPGVEAVATASAGPLFGGGDGAMELTIEGTSASATASWYNVGPGFFATLGVPVVRGREISEEDGIGAAPVAVVNEAFARRFLAGLEPIGRRVASAQDPSAAQTIIGVVRDVPPFHPGPAEPQIYWSGRQETRLFMYFALRTVSPELDLSATVREHVRRVDRQLRPSSYETIHEIERRELRRPLFNALLLTAFAITALALAGIGTYALLAYHVRQRDREMGVRLALGAVPRQVAALILRDGLGVAVPGVALGLLGAWGAGRLLRSISPGVSATDAMALGGSAALMLLVTLIACAVPARRAGHVAPVTILKGD